MRQMIIGLVAVGITASLLEGVTAAEQGSRYSPVAAERLEGLLLPASNSGFLGELHHTPDRRWSKSDTEEGWQHVRLKLRDAGVLDREANSVIKAARKVTLRGPNGSAPVYYVPIFLEASRLKGRPVWTLGLGWGTDYGVYALKGSRPRVEGPQHYWVLVLDGKTPHRVLGQTNCN
jgi:hypothetical protein